ncbi:hypothetical protein [Halomontanus rarus]|uniref:hypothetical protein n=1 Tax=Halomontanus rarus TaxID=3034020 RepID=UPI0023E876A4|nr:hypothetical protein [Halovivax sp. TS33]
MDSARLQRVYSRGSVGAQAVDRTVDEFFQHAEAEAILDQRTVGQFHRLGGMDLGGPMSVV